jgi:hypothetical protein
VIAYSPPSLANVGGIDGVRVVVLGGEVLGAVWVRVSNRSP